MKIVNRTHWDMRNVRRIVDRVAKAELPASWIKAMTVEVGYFRLRQDTRVSGYAYYHRPHIWIRLPKDLPPDPRVVASVVAHEFGHTQGLKHRDMRGRPRYTWAKGWQRYYEWASAFPIVARAPKAKPEAEPKPKPSRDEELAREIERAEKYRTKWAAQVAHAERKVAEYDRKLAQLRSTVRRREAALKVAASRAQKKG